MFVPVPRCCVADTSNNTEKNAIVNVYSRVCTLSIVYSRITISVKRICLGVGDWIQIERLGSGTCIQFHYREFFEETSDLIAASSGGGI